MLPWVCSVIDHRRRQNVVRTSVTHSAIASCATFLFLPHFDVICDLLPNRRTATWNLFVKWGMRFEVCRPRLHGGWIKASFDPCQGSLFPYNAKRKEGLLLRVEDTHDVKQ